MRSHREASGGLGCNYGAGIFGAVAPTLPGYPVAQRNRVSLNRMRKLGWDCALVSALGVYANIAYYVFHRSHLSDSFVGDVHARFLLQVRDELHHAERVDT
jgi:hypothetical protein